MTMDGYYCRDKDCPHRWCWAPGRYEHRGATGHSGSHNTGNYTRTCMYNAYHACPSPLPSPYETDDDYYDRIKSDEKREMP